MNKPVANQLTTGENSLSRSAVFSSETALTISAGEDGDYMADSESTKSPAFQFYPKDFVHGTLLLTTEEVGAYILLLCHCWDRGSIPGDVSLLARIAKLTPARMRRAWINLEPKFQYLDGVYIQPRLERERQKQADYRKRQADNGSKRWAGTHKALRSERLSAARRIATHTQEEWGSLLATFGQRCVKCGARGVELVKDHIIPIYRGGSDGIDNIQPLCMPCNSSKGPDQTDFRMTAERLPLLPLNASQKPTLQSSSSSSSSSSDLSQREKDPRTIPTIRAGAFCEWYADTHERLFGIGYMGTNLDYQKALELCGKFTDQQLRDAALVWFGDEDKFASEGTRSIPKFASRVSGYLQTIKAKGLAS